MKLALTLPKMHQENITSYVSRLAYHNGVGYMQDFCKDMGLEMNDLFKLKQSQIERLSNICSESASKLIADNSQFLSRCAYRFNEQSYSKTFFNMSVLKICHTCVKEMSFCRIHWQVSSIRACTKHGRLLQPLPAASYPRHAQDIVGRIADYHGRLRSTSASEQLLEFTKTIEAALYEGKPLPISELPLEGYIRLCENIGLLSVFGPKQLLTKLTYKHYAHASGVGHAICSQGFDAVYEFYKSIQNASTTERGGFQADFGFFARFMTENAHKKPHRKVIDHHAKFIFENYPIPKGQMIYGRKCYKQYVYTWQNLGQIYGVSPAKIKSYKKAVCSTSDTTKRKVHHQALREMARGLGRVYAGKHLGIGADRIDQMYKVGIIKPYIDWPNMDRLWTSESLDELYNQAIQNAVLCNEEVDGFWPIGKICNIVKLRYNQLINALIDGGLKQVLLLCGPRGLAALRLNVIEVLDMFEDVPLEGLTLDVVQKELNINATTMKALIDQRLLKVLHSKHPRSRRPLRLVLDRDLGFFINKYVSLGELAKDVGKQANYVLNKLNKQNIYPIDLPAHCNRIYRRRKISPDIFTRT